VLTAQAIINMFVVTGLNPTKGLPLPFISYGGSSMIISLLMIGVLLSVAGYSRANDFAPGSFWEESAHGK
jgi:cell division protein FtsW